MQTRKKKTSRRENTIKILKMIAIGALIIGLGAAPSPRMMSKLLRELLLGETAANRKYVGRKIRQLRNSGLLEKHGVAYSVSDKGDRVLSQDQIWNLVIPKSARWDGKWRLLMFDIPQSQADARKALNRIFLQMGLVQYQQSVLVFPYPIKETLLHVCRFYKVTRYVSFATSEEIDGSDSLKKHFSLS